jgi:tetratricopeptide (TPR) repeat protein
MLKHPVWRPILALAFLTVAVLAAGCDQSVQVAVLEGTITDALTGNPVSGARVVSGSKDAITNSDGQYVLQGLQPGTRSITVEAEGYTTFSTVIVVRGGLQQLDIKLTLDSTPKDRFEDIDKLIASKQYALAKSRLEKMLSPNWRDMDVLARLARIIAATVASPWRGYEGGSQLPKTHLQGWGIEELDDAYALYFAGQLYAEWALLQREDNPQLNRFIVDRFTHHPEAASWGWCVTDQAISYLTWALADMDNATIRFELGRIYHWYSTSPVIYSLDSRGTVTNSRAARSSLQLHAEEHLKKTIEYDPTGANAYAELAVLYADMMYYSEAKRILLSGIQTIGADTLTPESEVVLTEALAYVAMQEGAWQEGLDYALRCIELRPKEPMYHAYAGRCYVGLGDKYKAVNSLTRAKNMGFTLKFYMKMLDDLNKSLR